MSDRDMNDGQGFSIVTDAADVIRGLSYNYNSVYLIDLARRIMTPYAIKNDVAYDMLPIVQSSDDFDKIFLEFAEKFVVPDERESYLNATSIDTIVEELSTKDRYAHFVNRKNTEGTVELIEMAVNRLDNDDRPSRAVMTYRTLKKRAADGGYDVRAQLEREVERQKKERARESEILAASASAYLSMHIISMSNYRFTEIKSNDAIRQFQKLSESEDARVAVPYVMSRMCEPESLPGMNEFTDFRTLADRLADTDYTSYEFHGKVHGWCRARFVTISRCDDGTPDRVLYIVECIDGEYREQSLRTDVINVLSEEFTNVYTIDRKTSNVRIHRFSGKPVGVKSALSEVPQYDHALRAYIAQNVLEADREGLWEAGNFAAICARLEREQSFIYHYRVMRDGELHYYYMKCARLGDAKSFETIIAGFAIEDDAKRAEAKVLEQASIVQGLTELYYIVYYVDLVKDTYREIRSIDPLREVLRDCTSASEAMRAATPLVVRTENDEAYDFLTDTSTWADRIGDNNFAYAKFNGALSGWCRTDLVAAQRDDAGRVTQVIVSVRDINEEKRRDDERETYLALVDVLGSEYHTIWTVGWDDGKMTLIRSTGVNTIQSAVRMGTDCDSYQEAIDAYIDTFVAEPDRKRVRREVSFESVKANVPERGIYTSNYLRRAEDGTETYHQMAFARVEVAGGKRGFVLAYRDIDDMVKKERENQRALADALAAAEHANRSKTVFLNNMSHDIRTPMNAIIGFTGLAATHINNKEQVQDYLNKISTSSTHLLSLINDVLDMSRIESGKVVINEQPSSLPEVLHDLRSIVQADINAKRLAFFIDATDVENETIVCDKLRLSQILLNILSNAIKFTAPGGMVSVGVRQLGPEKNGRASYEFKIRDTGIGMAPEFLEHIFEPFERERTSTVSGIQGTGLGMSITKNIVEMMGGDIHVSSQVGKGSEFTVKFSFETSGGPVKASSIPQLEGVRALVADDNLEACASVSKMLSQVGMRAEWTTTGKEAIFRTKLAVEARDEFGVFIIDWLMPDMNGIEVVRRIRRLIGESTPIIILTEYDWADIEEEAREAGVTAFISKPLFMSELREALAQPFEEHKKVVVEKPVTPHFDGKRVLLVEDNELNREIAAEVLSEAGLQVEYAFDGAIAVDRVKEVEPGYYDAVLMDIQMPVMDGYEATRAIRSLGDERAAVPIIAMTANAFEEDKKAALAAGMNEHVSKPLDIAALFNLLAAYFA